MHLHSFILPVESMDVGVTMPGERYVECLSLVEELYNSGTPVKEIAKRCGNSMSTVYRALRVLEREGRIRRRRRSSMRRRVTEEEKEKMVAMYREGRSIYEIAKMLGRSPATVYRVVKKGG